MNTNLIALLDLTTLSVLVGIVASLVGAPLTVVMFYLRTIRDHQATRYADTLRRLDAVESSIRELTRTINEFERDYTTKEEWLRESLHARRQLENLTELTARIHADMESYPQLFTQFSRAADAIVVMSNQCIARPHAPRPAGDDTHDDRSQGA